MREDGSGTTALGAAPTRELHADPHDFAGLYIRHRSALTLHARQYLRDARDADEVVQEAFLRLFLALPELETELQALAYCRRTITNLCIDRYRAQARRPHLVDIATVPLEELADDEPLDPVVRAEDAAVVRTALSMLSPLHRAALVKREIEEKSLPVIAEELEVPEDSVKHLLFRARRALRRLLAGTSLVPGTDVEGAHGLAATVRAGSGGLAAFVLLLALGLGSGPDLEAIPVVGVDLPDIIGVTQIAHSVGSAVTGVVEAVSSSGGSDRTSAGEPAGGADPAPLSTATATATAAPGPAVGPTVPPGPPRTAAPAPTVTIAAPPPPEPAPDAPAPVASTTTPSPSASARASTAPVPASPSASPEPAPTPGPVPEATESPSAPASGSPAPTASASSTPTFASSVSEIREPGIGRLVESPPASDPAAVTPAVTPTTTPAGP